MKKQISSLTIFFLLLYVCGCNNKTVTKDDSCFTSDFSFFTDSLVLKMGELDHPTSGTISFYIKQGVAKVAQSNDKSRRISVYNYETGIKESEIDVKNIFPLGSDLYCHNEDTILACVNAEPVQLHLYCNKTLYSLDIPVHVESGFIRQYPRFYPNGIVLMNEKWYAPCFRLGEYPNFMKKGSDRPPVIEFDFNKKEYNFIGEYPELYANNNMATLHYWNPVIVGNDLEKKIIVAFKASPEIKVVSGEETSKSYYVKSQYADTIPLPFNMKGRDYFSNEESYFNYAKYSHYDRILFDPWKNLYYRIICIGLENPSKEANILSLPDDKAKSIMVLDDQFNKIDEVYIGNNHNVSFCFIGPKGLHLLRNDRNEDFATYDILNYNKL